MKIILTKNIGFCFGVKRALELSEKSLKKGRKPVYFLGEVIHNERITREIKKRGGKFISNPKEAKSGTLLIRAHGVPPLPSLKNLLIVDATCPLVKKAQAAAQALFRKSYRVIIIGDKRHPEIKGINGHIKNKAIIINNEKEAKELKKLGKIGVVAQTTQDSKKVKEILDILRKKTEELKWIDTLCPQVSLRQKELHYLSKKTDGILVIGSSASANTKKLVEIAGENKRNAWLINSAEELKRLELNKIRVLGVVSGTSTPDFVVKEIIDKLKTLK